MIKVLQVYPKLSNAGTEMVIMNLYNNLDRSKVQFDFLVEDEGELDKKFKEMGAKIHYLKERKNKKYYKSLLNFFQDHKEYKIVHTHTHKRMGLVLKAAHKKKIQVRIAHSHNSRSDLPKVFKIYKKITSRKIEKNSTNLFACSSAAAKWLFPRNHKRSEIVKNSIEIEKFVFQEHLRKKFRLENNIDQKTKIVCHVGRFANEKNHIFIIDVAKKLFEKDDSIKLILVGVGPLEEKIKLLSKKYNIDKKVLFLGNRTDIDVILSASDIFLLPSLHEGLGIVLIEAQASGLYSIASDAVPSEADIGLNIFEKIELSKGSTAWADKVLEKLDIQLDREQLSNASLATDYNIKKTVKYVEQFYLETN